MLPSSRRSFLLASASAASAAQVAGANGRIRIGVIGSGPRGQYLMKTLTKAAAGGVQWVAVCDVYDVRRNEAAQLAGSGVEQYLDYRQVIARKDIDAVIVATPDHWHANITVEALEAGKDVYVEKPMVHFPADGLRIVKAARAGKRVVQVGTQGRTLSQFVEAKQRYIDSGIIGKVGLARTWYTSNSGYVKTPPPGMERKPEGLDWNRWLGPSPHKPAWNPDIYFSPYKWLHYDGGMIMGIGIHVVDSAHHWLGLTRPVSATASGGIYFHNDGRDTPDVVTFTLEYPQKLLVTFEAECLTAPGVKTSAGVMLRGTGGALWAERYVQDTAWEYTPNKAHSQAPPAKGPGSQATAEPLLRNWIDCLRSRNKPMASEVDGYWSSVACFMANRAFQTRNRVTWDSKWDLPA